MPALLDKISRAQSTLEESGMKRELAQAVIDGWHKDIKIGQVPGIQEYVDEKQQFIPYALRVQVVVGAKNTLASDALWDGKDKTALAYLIKYGLRGNKGVKRAPKGNSAYIASDRLFGKARNPKADWKYVK